MFSMSGTKCRKNGKITGQGGAWSGKKAFVKSYQKGQGGPSYNTALTWNAFVKSHEKRKRNREIQIGKKSRKKKEAKRSCRMPDC